MKGSDRSTTATALGSNAPANSRALSHPSPRFKFAAGLTSIYLILAGYQIFHHVMWLDEWQAWLLARNSHSLRELFHLLRYETHPPLWHLCLYVFTRLTSDPRAMQAFHLALATSGVFVVAAWSRMTKLQAILYAFGYFVFYEYCAISRDYALGLLLTMIAALTLRRYCRRIGFYFVVALLAQAEPYGIVMAAALAMAALTQLTWESRAGRGPTARERRVIVSGLFLVSLSGIAGFVQTTPLPDCTFIDSMKEPSAAQTLHAVLRTFTNIPNFENLCFWNVSFFDPSFAGNRFSQCGLSAVILAVLVIVFAARPAGLVMLVLGIAGTLAALYVSASDLYRHSGHLFVALTAAYCISEDTAVVAWKPFARCDSMRRLVFTVLLGVQALPAVWAFGVERLLPFSGSAQAARYIQDHFPKDAPVLVVFDLSGPALSGCLGRPVYYTSRQEWGTFLNWDSRRVSGRNYLPQIRRLQKETGRDVVVVMQGNIPGLFLPVGRDIPKLVRVAEFALTINPCDRYGIYLAPYGQWNTTAPKPVAPDITR